MSPAETIIILQLTLRLQMALSSIKREQATIRIRCTIAIYLMLQIDTILPQQPHCYNNIMMLLSHFGFLCVYCTPMQTYVYVRVCMHLCMHVCVCVCVCVVCVHVCVCVRVSSPSQIKQPMAPPNTLLLDSNLSCYTHNTTTEDNIKPLLGGKMHYIFL